MSSIIVFTFCFDFVRTAENVCSVYMLRLQIELDNSTPLYLLVLVISFVQLSNGRKAVSEGRNEGKFMVLGSSQYNTIELKWKVCNWH